MSKDIDQHCEDQALKFVKEIDSIPTEAVDQYAPKVENESVDFLLPENQLTVNFEPQPTTTSIRSFTFKPGPLYLTTCYEEFSRHLIFVSVGKRMKSKIDLVHTHYEQGGDSSPQSLLQCYNPGYDYWYSSFKKGPCNIAHHLTGETAGDTHLVIRINRCLVKQKPFEPVFGSICLYTFLNDELHRLTETFYFDATPDAVRNSYRFFYCEGQESEFTKQPILSTSTNIADATGASAVNFNMFLSVFPEELRLKDVFMVVQLNKFLTTDAEKAIAPYLTKSIPTDPKKNREAAERLSRFRQPLGFAVSRLFDDSGKVLCSSAGEMTLQFYAQRVCFSDFSVGQVIKEMYPTDSSNPYYRFEPLDIELKMSLFDVGGAELMIEKMQEYKLFQAPPSRNQPLATLDPSFIESQILSQTSQLVFDNDPNQMDLSESNKCAIRKIIPLISPAFPWAKAVSRQLRSSVDNTMFLYPIQFDRFPSSFRNISAKLELIELRGTLPDYKVPTAFTAHDILCSIYNHNCISGPLFVKEAFTRVSYHTKNPLTSDEFKIRLPDVLNSRHWIKFTVYHVHVKLQAGRPSILQSIIRSNNEKDENDSSIIGVGYLPLMPNGDCLIGDEEHLVLLLSPEVDVSKGVVEARENNGAICSIPTGTLVGMEIPSIRVRTRALCSLVSMDRKVQKLFKNNPVPLGYLPSSIMPVEAAGRICYKACSLEPKEERLTSSLLEVTKANTLELSRHFLAIFRMLARSLLGGTCSYHEGYINPFQHFPARSQAFLSMITLFDKIFGDIGNSSTALNETSREREVLDVCVDYLLDEEIPIPPDCVHKIATHYLVKATSNSDLSAASSPGVSSSYSNTVQPFSPSHLDQLKKASQATKAPAEGKETDGANEITADDGENTSVRASPALNNESNTNLSSNTIHPVNISRPVSIRSSAISQDNDKKNANSSESSDDDEAEGRPAVYSMEDNESVSTNHLSSTSVTPDKSGVNEENVSQRQRNVDLEAINPTIASERLEEPTNNKTLVKMPSDLMDEDEDDIDAEEENLEPRITSADRRSWGGYITDSMWLSGRFSALNPLRSVAINLDADVSEKYLDDIAQHIILQVSRLIEERLINVAVHTISKVIEYNSSHNVDTHNTLTEDFILAGKRYRYSGAFDEAFPPVPFETEKAWFKSIDEGEFVDKDDVYVDSTLNLQHLARRLSSVRMIERESLHVGTVEPMYDALDGYSDRVELCLSPDPHFAIMKHWWPYLYEVLTYQWTAVLMMISPQVYNNIESMTEKYPNKFTSESGKEFRNLVMEHGPILLRMIHKSLALRINREGKRPPILLDAQYFALLENLIIVLALEASSVASTVWRSRRVVQALAKFINSLFALVAPKQVLKLIRSYFKTLRKSKSPVEETEQRLLFLQEISYFDHVVAVNFPYTLDAPVSLFCGSVDSIDNPPDELLALSYTFTGIRFALCPTPFTLAYTIISEVMASYRQDGNKRQAALEVLRDLLVRHAVDTRYQRKSKQQRIICMYIPLLGEFMKEIDRLRMLKYDSVERREMLAIVLHLLGGIPDRILRNIVRSLCAPSPSRSNSDKKDSRYISAINLDLSSSYSGPNTPLRVLSLKRDSTLATPDIEAFISQSTLQSLGVSSLILMLHLALDTFEVPKAAQGKEDNNLAADLLSPSTVLEGSTSTNLDTSSSPGLASVGSGSSTVRRASGGSGEGKGGNATALLANLDNRLQRKVAGSSRKSLPGVGKGDERRWAEHVRKMAKEQAKAKRIAMKSIPKSVAYSASSMLSSLCTKVILNTLWILLEECPTAMDSLDTSELFGSTGSFILRDCNIDESLLAGITNLRIVPFIRMVLCVLLHGLYCNQAEETNVDIFLSTVSVIRKFGAKMFLLAVEDSLQYWLRITLFYCGCNTKAIQAAACDFLLCLLRACFHYFGSFTLISTTLLAVLGDSLEEILDTNRHLITTFADEDKVLTALSDAIQSMRSAAENKLQTNRSPFCSALITFLNSLDVILIAHGDIRRYVTHPTGYDFYGANLLDGPWDARTSFLVQTLRQKRRAVRSDPGEQNSAAKAGFQIEEVMMRLVAAAELYDAYRLPRFRMFWLENLARLHELCGNRAEGAEIRWRIFLLAYELESTWMKLWSPRPPLQWLRRGSVPNAFDNANILNNLDPDKKKAGPNEGDRNFYRVLMIALDSKCLHPWLDSTQYITHMITALSVAIERFCSTNLVHLAERASSHLLTLFRLGRKTDLMISEYSRMATALKTTQDKGINTTIAMGTFYRVFYDGLGIPPFLRGKEFIFRNANHLHVSEFHALVISHLKAIVGEGIDVKMIQDANALADFQDPKIAYLIMNSVKLVMNRCQIISVGNVNRNSANSKKYYETTQVESLNQVNTFQYSVPFTQDSKRAHAKKMDDQWLRTTVLTTKEFFPYILTRQQVLTRETTVLTPIEAAMVDIEDCIGNMELELTVESKDNNNIMRIVQGSVLPQVNVGAAEVAKVFLSPSRILSEEMQVQLKMEAAKEITNELERKAALIDAGKELERSQALVIKLKLTLLNFLLCSKQLLLRTRRLLVPDISALEQPSPLLNEVANPYASSSPPSYPAGGSLTPSNTAPLVAQSAPSTAPNTTAGAANLPAASGSSGSSAVSKGLALFNSNRRSIGEAPLTSANLNTLNSANNPNTNANNSTTNSPYTQQEIGYIKWQNEMERGFENLVRAIYPYIAELREADVFNPSRYN